MNKFLKIISFFVSFGLFFNVVNATETDYYSLECQAPVLDAENTNMKNTVCILQIDNSTGHLEETDYVNVEIKYDVASNSSDFTLKQTYDETFPENIQKNNNGGTFKYSMGAIPTKVFDALEITLCQPTSHTGATIVITDDGTTYNLKIDIEEANTIDFLFTNKSMKLHNNPLGIIGFDKGVETFSTIYTLTNNDDSTYDGLLKGMVGYIDIASLPEGIELLSAEISDDESGDNATAITLNKDTGQWVVDFDISESGLKYQKENEYFFTFHYKITDSNALPDVFQTSLSVNQYITTSFPDLTAKADSPINAIYETETIDVGDEPDVYVMGDWDQNDKLSLTDIVEYRMYLVDPYEIDEDVLSLVDINQDGKVSITDLMSARRLLVGLSITE